MSSMPPPVPPAPPGTTAPSREGRAVGAGVAALLLSLPLGLLGGGFALVGLLFWDDPDATAGDFVAFQAGAALGWGSALVAFVLALTSFSTRSADRARTRAWLALVTVVLAWLVLVVVLAANS